MVPEFQQALPVPPCRPCPKTRKALLTHMFKRKPVLQLQDQKNVALANLSALQESLGTIYTTTKGLILQDHLVQKIDHRTEETTQSITIEELATEFGVSLEAIRACLPLLSKSQVFVDQSTVYGPQVLGNLASRVPETPQLSVEFCKDHQVTFKLLQQLRRSHNVALVGEYVVQQQALTSYKKDLEKQLTEANVPVNIPDSPLLEHIMSQLQYDGRFERASRVFIPTAYRNHQRDEWAAKIKDSGTLEVSKVPFDAKKFSKRYNFSIIHDYYVTEEYIQQQHILARNSLETEGIFDSSDLEIPIPLDLKAQEPLPGVYMRPSYESKLKSQLCDEAANQGEKDATGISDVEAGSNARQMVNTQLKPPSLADIQQQLSKLPPKLAKVLAQKFTVPVRDSYLSAATKALELQIKKAQSIVTARIAAYLEGVVTITSDSQLQHALFEEWQNYAGENDPAATVVSSIDQAKEYFKVEPTLIEQTVTQIIATNKYKLSKAKDPATVLHMAVVIQHSRMFDNKAILKCRGKQIPKLLKQFEFPVSFQQLKSDVTKKADASESITKVKEIVL